jgi:hypothetical protein
LYLCSLGLAFTVIQSLLLPDAKPSNKVEAPLSAVYLPAHSDTREPVRLMVESDLSSACYKLNPPSVRVQLDRNVILVHLEAVPLKPHCIPDETRSIEQIEIGKLPKGEYEVRSLKTLKKWGTIAVEKAPSNFELAQPEYQTADRLNR